MFTEMLDKINKCLEEREEKKYQKLQRELEEEYGDPDEVPESTYEEVENTDEINMNIQEPVEEEINMNIQEPTEEEIDMNVMPKKKKGIRSFFKNLKKNKKGIRSFFQNSKEKKKSLRNIFQNLKAKVMKKSNSELKESTTKMDIANATLFTIIQSIILTGTIVVGIMNPAVGFLAGILATGCSLAVIADIKDVMMKVKEYKTSQPVQEENYEEIDEELEQDISTEKANTEDPIISYSFTKNGPEIAEVDLSNIHTEPGLHINQELFGFKNESADIKHFVVNREDEEVSNYVANEIENATGMEPIYNDYTVEDKEKRVYVLTR